MEELFSYIDIDYSIKTLKMELEGILDESLLEECLYYGTNFQCSNLNEIAINFTIEGKLKKGEREKLEGIYILLHCELYMEE